MISPSQRVMASFLAKTIIISLIQVYKITDITYMGKSILTTTHKLDACHEFIRNVYQIPLVLVN